MGCISGFEFSGGLILSEELNDAEVTKRSPLVLMSGITADETPVVVIQHILDKTKQDLCCHRQVTNFTYMFTGYSDPFCTVLVGGKKIFTTNVKKKTLFPKWNETVTTELNKDAPEITIVSSLESKQQ